LDAIADDLDRPRRLPNNVVRLLRIALAQDLLQPLRIAPQLPERFRVESLRARFSRARWPWLAQLQPVDGVRHDFSDANLGRFHGRPRKPLELANVGTLG
jgi:hypothetical protein